MRWAISAYVCVCVVLLFWGLVLKPVEEDESTPKGCLQACGAVAA